MPQIAFYQSTVLVHWKALRSEGYRLIKPHVLANNCGFSNDHACAVIDEKAPTDLRAWMNFNTGRRMGDFGDHASDQRSAQVIQFVGEAVMGNGGNTGIADQYLIYASRGRVAFVRCLDVTFEQAAYVRQPLGKCPDNGSGLLAISIIGGIDPRNKA